MSTVYCKTEKGQAEIDTRAFRLLPRLRQALILVDGRRSEVELAKLILAEPEATLSTLAAQGFIEAAATVAEPAQAATPAAEAATRKAPTTPDALRRDAVRYLTDKLGPAAEGIAIKLERTKSMAELRPLLVSAGQLLRSARGSTVSDEFVARFLSEETVSSH